MWMCGRENEGKDSQIFNALVKKPVNLIITSCAINPHAHEHALAMCMTTMNASRFVACYSGQNEC